MLICCDLVWFGVLCVFVFVVCIVCACVVCCCYVVVMWFDVIGVLVCVLVI